MLSPQMDVTFSVRAKTRQGESVLVVGDCPELGSWSPHRAKQLQVQSVSTDGEIWSKTVKLPSTREVKYRYFTAYLRDSQHEGEGMDVMVTGWETNILPRTFSLKAAAQNPNTSASVFGTYGGRTSIDKGWLTGQAEVQVRLHSNPVNMWKQRHRQQTYQIKCTPIDMRYKDSPDTSESSGEVHLDVDDEDSNHDLVTATGPNQVYVSVLDGKNDETTDQPQFGVLLEDNSYVLFRAQTFEPEHLGYQFDFYVHEANRSPQVVPKHVGTSYLLPVVLSEALGSKVLPITGLKNKPIGQLTVEYFITKPLPNYDCDMSVSYSRHWKRQRRPLDVGHRGMGNSYTTKQCAAVRENTLASLADAGGHGADFVEFDIQLSSDKIPVIYHDFLICISLKKKGRQELEYFEIPVNDLSFAQLQMLKVDHISEKSKGKAAECESDQQDSTETQPFPTLRQCLEALDPHLGFNCEIKYCQKVKDGGLEEGLKHFPERNAYLDIILTELLQHAGNRRIVLSCFDADVCTMMRLKQNRYPVFFLCYGPTPQYTPYFDKRTWSIPSAISFAVSEQLLGLNVHAVDLLKDNNLVKMAKDRNLVLFCWGEDNNDKENIRRLKDMGVDAVIYDRIYELKEGSKVNVFKMENEAKVEMLQDMGIITGTDVSPLSSTSNLSKTMAAAPGLDRTSSENLLTMLSQLGAGAISGEVPAAGTSNGAPTSIWGQASNSGSTGTSNGVPGSSNGDPSNGNSSSPMDI